MLSLLSYCCLRLKATPVARGLLADQSMIVVNDWLMNSEGFLAEAEMELCLQGYVEIRKVESTVFYKSRKELRKGIHIYLGTPVYQGNTFTTRYWFFKFFFKHSILPKAICWFSRIVCFPLHLILGWRKLVRKGHNLGFRRGAWRGGCSWLNRANRKLLSPVHHDWRQYTKRCMF